jgi:hypothetical protein
MVCANRVVGHADHRLHGSVQQQQRIDVDYVFAGGVGCGKCDSHRTD